jgi:DHA2 family multidrug resistance protein
MVMYANLSLLPPMMETLLGYPTLDAGMTLAPRSLGTVTGMYMIARLAGKMDERILVGIGYSLVAHSVWQMTRFSFDVPQWMIMWTGFEQGVGTGLAIVSLTTLAFASLPTSLRNEGSAMYALIRNLAGSISLSVLQAKLVDNTQVMHARLTETISPFNMMARSPMMAHQLETVPGMAGLNATISAQAQMVAYLNDFKLVMVLTFLTLPMVLFVRPARSAVAAASAADLHNDIHIE